MNNELLQLKYWAFPAFGFREFAWSWNYVINLGKDCSHLKKNPKKQNHTIRELLPGKSKKNSDLEQQKERIEKKRKRRTCFMANKTITLMWTRIRETSNGGIMSIDSTPLLSLWFLATMLLTLPLPLLYSDRSSSSPIKFSSHNKFITLVEMFYYFFFSYFFFLFYFYFFSLFALFSIFTLFVVSGIGGDFPKPLHLFLWWKMCKIFHAPWKEFITIGNFPAFVENCLRKITSLHHSGVFLTLLLILFSFVFVFSFFFSIAHK